MSIVRVGATKKYADNFDKIFGTKKKAAKKTTAKKKKTTKKKSKR